MPTRTIDARKVDFLNRFEPETRTRIIEFGKRISSDELSADVYLVMARKAICFIDMLMEFELATLNGIIISDRVLDMNADWLKGKCITIIDDALISGTTLRRRIDILEQIPVKEIKVCVLTVSEDWFNPDMLMRDDGSTYLQKPFNRQKTEKCMQMCYEIVKALSTIPKPYDIDFPYFHEISIEEQWLNVLLNNSWSVFNVTSSSHMTNSIRKKDGAKQRKTLNEYESITFLPSSSVIERLSSKIGVELESVGILKMRAYIRHRIKDDERIFISFVPFVILNRISTLDIDKLYNHFFASFKAKEILNKYLSTYSAKFRLLQYVISFLLAKEYFIDTGLNKIYSVPDMAIRLLSSNRLGYIFPKDVAIEIFKFLTSSMSFKNETLELNCTTTPSSKERKRYDYNSNVIATNNYLLNSFLKMYREKEIKARVLAKENGRKVFALDEYIDIMNRLEKGISYKDMIDSIKDVPNAREVVSIFLDYAIDTGIAVPITYQEGCTVCRAYRHGEDVIFAEKEAKQLTYMLSDFQSRVQLTDVPALLVEKLLTTFIRFGLYKNIFEKYDYKQIHEDALDYIKIVYYLHGPTARYIPKENTQKIKPYVTPDESSIWLRDLLATQGYLSVNKFEKSKNGNKEDELTRYYVSAEQNANLQSELSTARNGIEAKKISALLAHLYNKKILTVEELILLNSAFGFEEIIPALLAEINVIKSKYSNYKMAVKNAVELNHASAYFASNYRRSNFFTSMNSAVLKLSSYYKKKPRSIVERIAEHRAIDIPENEHYYDDWRLFWDERLSDVEEEVTPKIQRLIDQLSIITVQFGLIFRTIEFNLCVLHDINSRVRDYVDSLRGILQQHDVIKNKNKAISAKSLKSKASTFVASGRMS